jgi:hypothetical protein
VFPPSSLPVPASHGCRRREASRVVRDPILVTAYAC